MPQVELQIPLVTGKITRKQYERVVEFLDEWKAETLNAAKRHPAKSYKLGAEQTQAFLNLLGELAPGVGSPLAPEPGPTSTAAVQWLREYTLTELEGALGEYVDAIKTALMLGLREGTDPLQVASWMYHATKDGEVHWRMIARTEMTRANAEGRLDTCVQQGYDRVWVPPHAGSCSACKRLIENQVFDIAQVRGVTNYKVPYRQWQACVPLHPNCRHIFLPYQEDIYNEAQRQYRAVRERFTDRDLDEMFTEGGMLKPEFQEQAQELFAAQKVHDPYAHALALAVEKCCGTLDVAKGFFDNQQAGLDPLLWSDRKLRHDVRERIVQWWRNALGSDAPLWSRLYLTGGEAAFQWASPKHPEADPDLDVQIVVDYNALRRERPSLKSLTAPEAHAALVSLVKAGLADQGVELAPGMPLDAFIRPESTQADLVEHIRGVHQALYSLQDGWLITPEEAREPEAEYVANGLILEGPGAEAALEHSDWLEQARIVATALQQALTAHETDPDEDTLAALHALYTKLHDLRASSFAPDGGGETSRGNFIWQYLTNFGVLPTVKRIVHPEYAAKCYPDLVFSEPEVAEVAKLDGWARVGQSFIARDGSLYEVRKRNSGGYLTTGDEFVAREDALWVVAKFTGLAGAVPGRKAPKAPGWTVGNEHWITVHPHGPDTKGLPVLVRDGKDGLMRIIGGVGGHMNGTVIDPRRKIRHRGGKTEPAPEVADNRTPEEIAADEAAANARLRTNKVQLATLNEQRREVREKLEAHIAEMVDAALDSAGRDYHFEDLSATQQKKVLKRVKASAMGQTVAGRQARRDLASIVGKPPGKTDEPQEDPEAGTLEQAVEEERAAEAEENARKAAEEAGEEYKPPELHEGEDPERSHVKRVPAVSLDPEEAESIASLQAELRVLGKKAKLVRRAIAGDTTISDAMALDYSADDVEEEKKKDIEREVRTDVMRALVETTEGVNRPSSMHKAEVAGAFDTIDSFAQAVLGYSTLEPVHTRLLGVQGMAQLVAFKLYEEAKKGNVSLPKVYAAIDSLEQERESVVAERARARALKATEQAKAMQEAKAVSGQETTRAGLTTLTQANSLAQTYYVDAAKSLGYAISSIEATSALRIALTQVVGQGNVKPGMKGIKVPKTPGMKEIVVAGFPSNAAVKEAGRAAGIEVAPEEIHRNGRGNYELRIDPHRLDSLLQEPPREQAELVDRLTKIRTAPDSDREIQRNRRTPGMVDELRPHQARGKMFLLETKHGLLGFSPGTGKTHAAVAAAFQVMHDEPDKHHKALIVCPASMMRQWRDVIARQGGEHSVQIMSAGFDPGTGGPETDVMRGRRKTDPDPVANPADFNIVSWETYQRHAADYRAMGCTIRITDETQKAKSGEKVQVYRNIVPYTKDFEYRWGLTGTPLEKNTGELHASLALQDPEGLGSRHQFRTRYDELGQYPSIAEQDRIRQFREDLQTRAYFMSAADIADNAKKATMPPQNADNGGEMHLVKVDLPEAHLEKIREMVEEYNHTREVEFAKRDAGLPYSLPSFGGRGMIMGQVLNPDGIAPEENVYLQKVCDLVEENPDYEYDGKLTSGEHAGKYAGKTVIFAATTRDLNHARKALRARGIKVYQTASGAQNQSKLDAFKADDGRCVLLTTDANKAGIDLHLGMANGRFQHGATRLIHLDRPRNNATIQQRDARICRDGGVAATDTYFVATGLPFEEYDQAALDRERRRMDLQGNVESPVPAAVGETDKKGRPKRVKTARGRYVEAGGKIASANISEERVKD